MVVFLDNVQENQKLRFGILNLSEHDFVFLHTMTSEIVIKREL